MKYIYWTMAIFALLGALDRIFGNKLGLGKEFEKGIMLTGTLILTMTGMLVLAPFFAWALNPIVGKMDGLLDPSFLAGILLPNDTGGGALAMALTKNGELGVFHGCVVGSMMGATISFTLPYALGVVGKEKHKGVLIGLVCGMITLPIGCFIGGLFLHIPVFTLFVNILPLLAFALPLAFLFWKKTALCVKIFSWLGLVIKAVITVGVGVGIFQFLTGKSLIPHTATISGTIDLVLGVSCTLAGALPLFFLLSKLLDLPLKKFGKSVGMNENSTLGLFSQFATSIPMYATMDKMDDKGVIFNAAFSVSGAFVFADHLAYTMAVAPIAVPAVVIGKLTSGILAVVLAVLICKGKTKA